MEKKTVQDYIDIINQKKWDAHNIQWLYIDINAKELMTEVEPKVNNLTACCKAMMEIDVYKRQADYHTQRHDRPGDQLFPDGFAGEGYGQHAV